MRPLYVTVNYTIDHERSWHLFHGLYLPFIFFSFHHFLVVASALIWKHYTGFWTFLVLSERVNASSSIENR
jgi:hypothetical protein